MKIVSCLFLVLMSCSRLQMSEPVLRPTIFEIKEMSPHPEKSSLKKDLSWIDKKVGVETEK